MPDQTFDVDVDPTGGADEYFWAAYEVGTYIELNFPVHHSDEGYLWYLTQLYADCDLDWKDTLWTDLPTNENWYYQEMFLEQTSVASYPTFPDTQKVTFMSELVEHTPYWTFYKAKDALQDICSRSVAFDSGVSTAGDRMDASITWFKSDIEVIHSRCHFCTNNLNTHLYSDGAEVTAQPGGTVWADNTAGNACDLDLDSGDFSVTTIQMPDSHGLNVANFDGIDCTANAFPGIVCCDGCDGAAGGTDGAVKGWTEQSAEMDSDGDQVFPLEQIDFHFNSDCTGLQEITLHYPTVDYHYNYDTAATGDDTYSFTLNAGEFVV